MVPSSSHISLTFVRWWDNFREVLLEREGFLVSSLSLLCGNRRLRQDFNGIRSELSRTASETETSKNICHQSTDRMHLTSRFALGSDTDIIIIELKFLSCTGSCRIPLKVSREKLPSYSLWVTSTSCSFSSATRNT